MTCYILNQYLFLLRKMRHHRSHLTKLHTTLRYIKVCPSSVGFMQKKQPKKHSYRFKFLTLTSPITRFYVIKKIITQGPTNTTYAWRNSEILQTFSWLTRCGHPIPLVKTSPTDALTQNPTRRLKRPWSRAPFWKNIALGLYNYILFKIKIMTSKTLVSSVFLS